MSIKRLCLSLQDHEHQAIKLAAYLDGKTIKAYIMDKLFSNKKIPNQETLQAMREVEEDHDNLKGYTPDEFLTELRKIREKS